MCARVLGCSCCFHGGACSPLSIFQPWQDKLLQEFFQTPKGEKLPWLLGESFLRRPFVDPSCTRPPSPPARLPPPTRSFAADLPKKDVTQVGTLPPKDQKTTARRNFFDEGDPDVATGPTRNPYEKQARRHAHTPPAWEDQQHPPRPRQHRAARSALSQ